MHKLIGSRCYTLTCMPALQPACLYNWRTAVCIVKMTFCSWLTLLPGSSGLAPSTHCGWIPRLSVAPCAVCNTATYVPKMAFVIVCEKRKGADPTLIRCDRMSVYINFWMKPTAPYTLILRENRSLNEAGDLIKGRHPYVKTWPPACLQLPSGRPISHCWTHFVAVAPFLSKRPIMP